MGAPPATSIRDLRVNTAAALNEVQQELADPIVFWDRDETLEFTQWYDIGWSVKLAPHVVTTAVSGTAWECCSGAGGIFFSHEIDEVIIGDSDQTHILTGGHAYYGSEACGDTLRVGSG